MANVISKLGRKASWHVFSLKGWMWQRSGVLDGLALMILTQIARDWGLIQPKVPFHFHSIKLCVKMKKNVHFSRSLLMRFWWLDPQDMRCWEFGLPLRTLSTSHLKYQPYSHIFIPLPFWKLTCNTGRIQIRLLTNCQAISTEIGTDSLKI